MSEARANPPLGEEPSPQTDGPRSQSPSELLRNADPAARLLAGAGEPSDDAPTVISKAIPKPVATEDAFTGGLRGRRLAHFELIEPIGVGGMAAVIRALDTQLDRQVALKILPPEMAADPENVRRFHQEARSAAKLDHETIARVFFCGEDQQLHFIAFEFVEGDNLRALIDKRGRLPAAEAIGYMLQIATGLAHAASRGVVHRDIKPSNIIISPNGKAKLVDMGLARSLERNHDDGLTQSGVTLGTFDYISPEQALEPREADTRSDIYSLGCTFYHALTGQPPVPEGTAAKKLHHHHHVKPVDPRQMVPNLPDAVAVVLSRMMAKRVVDRYQSPEELVHDLRQAARGAGVSSEITEKPTSAITPRPAAPVGRPLALAGAAALLVVGLVLLADLGGAGPQPPSLVSNRNRSDGGGTGPPEATEPAKDAPARPIAAVGGTTAKAKAERQVYEGLARSEDIQRWVAKAKADGATELEIRLPPGDLTLVADDPKYPPLEIEATKILIRPKNPGADQRPTIKLSHRSPPPQPGTWAALTLSGQDVSVEGVRFMVDALGGNYEMVGLRLLGRGHYQVKNCEFDQVTPSFDPVKRLASVRAEATAGRSSTLRLEECCFLGYQAVEEITRPGMNQTLQPSAVGRGGQDAVVRRGAVQVEAVNCAFGPHAAAFRFEGAPANAAEGRADVRHCSVLAAADSAVFDFAARASADLHVEACLFSRPTDGPAGMGTGGPTAVLLRQAAPAGNPPLVYVGKDNRYHNLDGLWLTADGPPALAGIDFDRKLKESGGGDRDAVVLMDSPWKATQPLKELEQSVPARALRPSERLADLRIPTESGGETVAGIERIGGDDFAEGLAAVTTAPTARVSRGERLVDPTAEDDPAHRVYKKLEDAVNDASPGDAIVIRWRDRLQVGAIRPNKGAIDLTIRPAPGCRPELILTDTAGTAAMFELRDGWLKLEDLDFRVQPGDETQSLALVALAGPGQCTLKGCKVTLERGGSLAPLAVATVPESVGAADVRPQLTLDGCFVRGEGEVVSDRSGRPLDLEVRNTLAVLTGSFLSVASPAESAATGQKVQAKLEKVTTYLTDHLVRLQTGKQQRAPVLVQCQASACLFVAAAGRSLIHLDGPETGEDRLKDRLVWTGERNAYGNLKDRMFDQGVPGDEMAMAGPTVSADRWKSLFREGDNAQFLDRAPFAEVPSVDAPFSRVEPTQMRPVGNLPKEVGAGMVPMPAASAER